MRPHHSASARPSSSGLTGNFGFRTLCLCRAGRPTGRQPGRRSRGGHEPKSSGGALRKLADFFASPDPEKEKRRELKGVARSLRKINNRLYNPKSEQALPGLAKLFFEFYRTLGPAQNLLAHAKSSAVLRPS